MISILKSIFRLQFVLILLAVLFGVYYNDIANELKLRFLGENAEEAIALNFHSEPVGEMLLTKEQLSKFDGEDGKPLYLALLGSIYDVTKGKQHYGTGCSYNFFIGRDASVSFITGEFDNFVEEKADDVIVLTPSELLSLDNWKKFYDKDYTYKGKLIGRFYDENGEKTAYHYKYAALLEQAREAKVATDQMREIYPDCNIEWSSELGTRVWCTKTSGGGKERQWAGYPRKLFAVGGNDFRCACVKEEELDTTAIMIKPYDNCERLSAECYYKLD